MFSFDYEPMSIFKHYRDDGCDYVPPIIYHMNTNRRREYKCPPVPVKVTEPVRYESKVKKRKREALRIKQQYVE